MTLIYQEGIVVNYDEGENGLQYGKHKRLTFSSLA